MKQVIINQVCRAGSTSIKEIELGGKIINTIGTLPKLQSRSDIELFFGRKSKVPTFDGVVLDLCSLHDISRSLFVGEGQRRLDDNEIAVTREKLLMDEKAIFIDPNSEEYHYPLMIRKEKITGNSRSRLDSILSLQKYPSAVKAVFIGHRGDTAWRELESKKLLLSYVDWYVQHCLKYRASIILPPSPLVDGRKSMMLGVLKSVNATCQEITRNTTEAYPATYIPIKSDAFLDDKAPQRIVDTISDLLRPHSILALKFYRTEDMLHQVMARRRLRQFLIAIDVLKKEYHESVAVMVLDTRAEGLAYFGSGVDLTCDPLGGIQDRPKRRKKTNQIKDDECDEPENFGRYGKWYHPELRDYLLFAQVRSILNDSGRLPHSCQFCDDLGDSLTKEQDEPGFPMADQWNKGRRFHNFICRQEEDATIRDSVIEGEMRAVELFLRRETRADKNLLDILP
jgi:hypothetical protein